MDTIAFTLSLLANIAFLVVVIFGKNYITSYVNEKGKNTATKEDIEDITKKIENIKSSYQIEIEKAKHEYELKGAFVEKKRHIYEKLSSSLRIFIEGQGFHPELENQKKDDFLNSYSTSWLWSSDEVLNALHKFLDLEASFTENASSVNILDRKKAFSAIMVAMRKDCGFFETNAENYQFHTFID